MHGTDKRAHHASTHTLSRWPDGARRLGQPREQCRDQDDADAKATMMFNAATTPNSMSTGLVRVNVANPNAVVALVKSVALPTLVTIRCSAIILLPWRLNSAIC